MESILKSECEAMGLNFDILASIVQVESSWNPWVTRYERNFVNVASPSKYCAKNKINRETEIILQQMSWGLGQIMGGTARFLGYEGPLTVLVDPAINLHLTCEYFVRICKKYNKVEEQLVAYNAGTVIYNQAGILTDKAYADKVMKALSARNIDTKSEIQH